MSIGAKLKLSLWAMAIGLVLVPMTELTRASTNPDDGLLDLTWDDAPQVAIEEARIKPIPDTPDGLWPITTTSGATIHRDLSKLPEAARTMRNRLISAAMTGDIESLAPLFKDQTKQPVLGFDINAEDPVRFLKETSNDGEGLETLAIMAELLDAPYAAYNEGTDDEFFVWPYFVARDLERLNPTELIDLYKIVSYQDLQSMQDFGGWFYYRVSISAKGEWRSFVAGD